MVICIKICDATFIWSVHPHFVQNKDLEQSTFEQHHDQCAPISVVVKCHSRDTDFPLPPLAELGSIENADLSTIWKTVFRGLKPAAITLAAEGEDSFQVFVGKYHELLDGETEELGQIGGAVRFACSRGEEEVVEGFSQSVYRWYVVDGSTMQSTGMCPQCFARGPQSIFR